MNKKLKINSRGETIVEVLISMALIAVTITAAYVSGVNTMHQIQSAKEKQDAVSIARQQIELLASYSSATIISPGTCLSYSNNKITNSTTADCNAFNIGSVLGKVEIKNIANINGSSVPITYQIKVSWVGSSGSSNVTMYYIRKN